MWDTPVIGLLWDTRQALLQWGFSSTNEATKGEVIKALLEPLLTNVPRADTAGQRECCLWLHVSELQSTWLARRCTTVKCTLRMAETRENILTGHRAKTSGHRTRRKEKPHSVFTKRTHSKVCLNRRWPGENHSRISVWGQLEQAYSAFACNLPCGFPSLRQMIQKTKTKTVIIFGGEKNQYSLPNLPKLPCPRS